MNIDDIIVNTEDNNYEKSYKFDFVVSRVIYYNDETCYGVYEIAINGEEQLPNTKMVYDAFEMVNKQSATLVGKSTQLEFGFPYTVEAEIIYSEKYKAYNYQIKKISGQRNWSKINPSKFLRVFMSANRVETLISEYPDILQKIIEDPEWLPDFSKLKGIGEKTFENIRTKVLDNYEMGGLISELAELGISLKTIARLYESEEDASLVEQKIMNNPYELTKIDGIGFKKADSIALRANPSLAISSQRCVAAINYILREAANENGNTWVLVDELVERAKSLIPECGKIFRDFINGEISLCKNSSDGAGVLLKISDDELRIGLRYFYNIEKKIYDSIKAFEENSRFYKEIDIDEGIKNFNEKSGYVLTSEQENFVRGIRKHGVSVLVGHAGTGKSLSLKAVYDIYKGKSIEACAFSAKAARRIIEVTGRNDAKTIHRLLGYNGKGFTFDENNKLQCDILILDEAGMVPVDLFWYLIKALPSSTKLIIVGDDGQLPPIGAGAVLKDLQKNKNISITHLTKIHRQAQQSAIIMDANAIRRGDSPIEEFTLKTIHGELKDMFYAFRGEKEDVRSTAINTFRYLYKTRGIPVDDIGIIVPVKNRGVNCTDTFNAIIQNEVIVDKSKSIELNESKFYIGDRVIQCENDYDREVINGETGKVVNIEDNVLYVEFPDYSREDDEFATKIIAYKSKAQLSQLSLAYALTVHRLQGSSIKYAIVAIDVAHTIMLDTTILYTAITRAVKECYLIAQPDAFLRSLSRNKVINRQTYLDELYENDLGGLV